MENRHTVEFPEGNSPYRMVYSSCPDAETAESLAQALVEKKLAACVSQIPGMRSSYPWQGQIEHADEIGLLIKTRADRMQALLLCIHELHPYELPEIVAVPMVQGSRAYFDWMDECLAVP